MLLLLATLLTASPQKVDIGVYVLNIGKFELASGGYTVDFYLRLHADRPLGPLALEFLNGRAQSELLQTEDEGKTQLYRVLANLSTNIDLRRYPLDGQRLPIVLEHKVLQDKDFVFVPDPAHSGVDPDVTFVGWDLAGAEGNVVTHDYPVFAERYSRFLFDVKIERIRIPAILKTFLPIFCFVLINLLSMFITLEKIDNRLSMGIGILIASVMFHVSLGNTIPPVGYLTLVDKAMIASYVVVGTNLLITVLVMRRMQGGARELAQKLAARGDVVLPAVVVAAFAVAMMA
jgi:hypothetical protein